MEGPYVFSKEERNGKGTYSALMMEGCQWEVKPLSISRPQYHEICLLLGLDFKDYDLLANWIIALLA